MSRSKARAQGRREHGRFAGIPHAVMEHACFTTLGHPAVRLLLELAKQYNGHNNGDLTAAYKVMRKRGWKSRDTVDGAVRELMHHWLILKSRQGGKNACNLYALTWVAVDNCKGKLDLKDTMTPPGDWRLWTPTAVSDARQPVMGCPADGQGTAQTGVQSA